jgi:hypothetical protein
MKITTQQPLAVVLTALLAAQAAFVINTSHAQVTFQQVTNGLVDYYPLDSVLGGATPDLISRRDMALVNMTAANIVAASHPGINESNAAMNFSQSGGPTVISYTTTGQNPFDGSGDFLPFIDQRGATMNFWVKAANPLNGNEYRAMAECANDGQSSPFFSISTKGSSTLGTNASFFLRAQNPVTDPNGVSAFLMSDGTYEFPVINYLWNQGANDTSSNVFDSTWHMLTMEIGTNGDMHVFVDGIYDPGDQIGGPWNDNEGQLTVAPSMSVTNGYYDTNIYPNLTLLPAGTNTPSQYVHWLMPDLCNSAKTVFGGFIRNNAISGGIVGQMSDIGFWNRTLSTNEIQFVMTNGLPGLALNTNIISINSFATGVPEVGQGNSVNLSWNVTGASGGPGGLFITGVGDVTAIGPVGSTNVTLSYNQTYSFTLIAHNGIVADKEASVSVKVLQGVPSDWKLIQRFDGLFGNTSSGVNGANIVSLGSDYNGALDLFNVVTVNGNKVLSPKSGYRPDINSAVGYDTEGAITWANLNNLTVPPYQENTVFFRFSLTDPGSLVASTGFHSGLDFAFGLTDFGFSTGPIGGSQPPGGGGTVGPGFHIVRYDASGSYLATPFDLQANDYNGSSVSSNYDYLTDAVNGNANGLQTNVNYYCWLDVSNDNTHAVINGGVTNTVQEPVFSLWIQKQGDPGRTLLFSGFHGDRDYSQYGINSDFPSPYLNKIFMSVASEAVQSGDNGAFFETNNMIVLDDLYLSANGFDSTIPRLFNLTSIAQAANGNVTINWESLGSLFQTNTYTVQRKINLTDATWSTLQTGVVSGGDTTSFTDTTVSGNTHAFYRITWP